MAGTAFGARQRGDIDVAYVWREVFAPVPRRNAPAGPFSAQHIPTDDDAAIKRRDRKHRAIPAPQAER